MADGALEWSDLACPYCGEWITVAVDTSAGDQVYTEDCQVCCRPIVIGVVLEGDGVRLRLRARREDEA
jgi:hypothetical protein